MEEVRLATLAVVENALKLRAELRRLALTSERLEQAAKVARLPILYHEENYFAKVVADVSFISDSQLAKLFKFSRHFDPFFLSPSQPALPLANQTLAAPASHSMLIRYLKV